MSYLRLLAVVPIAWIPPTDLESAAPGPVEVVADRALREVASDLEQFAIDGVGRAVERDFDDPYIGETEHYIVRATKSPRFAHGLAIELERMLPRFQEFFSTDFAPSEPFEVVVYPDNESYRAFGEGFDERSSVFGGFYIDENGLDLVAVDDDLDNLNQLRLYLAYAATHQYIAHAFPNARLPQMFQEGLGAYFMLKWDPLLTAFVFERFNELRKGSEWISLETIVGGNRSTIVALGRGNDPFFELSYTMYHLRHNRSDSEESSRREFDEYLGALLRGESVGRNPVRQLLTRDLDKLEGVVKRTEDWREQE